MSQIIGMASPIVLILVAIGIILCVLSIIMGGSKLLGIIGIILSILIAPLGIVIGIIALVKANN